MSANTDRVELRFLGRISVRAADRAEVDAVVAQSKRLALLAYLALQPGFHRRDTLLGLFWPELDTKGARRALRQALHFLREQLGDVFAARGGEEIAVDGEKLWCDGAALDRGLAESDPAAVDLYQGELLPGLHVANASTELGFWLDRERDRLQRKVVEALRSAATSRMAAGEPAAAVGLARRALALAPAEEPALRQLMKLLDACGDRAGAIQAFEEFSTRIRADLEVEPSPESEALARRIRGRGATAEALPAAAEPVERRPLPDFITPLVGRRREIAAGATLLRREDVRLLTVIGPGGIGKSRLTVEIARALEPDYPDGVWYVPLVPVSDPVRVLGAIALALGVEARDDRLDRAVVARLRDRRALLVLDNFEHLLGAAAEVGRILREAPGVDALVASRTSLSLTIEHELLVPSLSLPAPGRRIGLDLPLDSEAVAMFVARARFVDPGFRLDEENVDSVSEICRRLDGLPLAIELAAARIRHLPVQEIARRLTGGTDILGGGARDLPDRQRTLDSTIRWASDLLDEEERALFHGLSVFAGEFGLSTVEAVWPELSSGRLDTLDGMAALVDRALLQRPAWVDGEPRYAMLRTVRDHAARELERSGRGDEWRRRLALHYSRWASDGARAHLCEPTEAEWLERVEREHDNLRSILDWATGALPAAAAAITAAVYYYWYTRGMATEGRERIERVLTADGQVTEEVRARLVVAAGGFAGAQGDLEESLEWRRRGLEIYRRLGDPGRIGWALQNLGIGLRESGALGEATAALEEALALGRATEDPGRVMFTLCALGEIALLEGDPERAEGMLRESLVLAGRQREPGTQARCLAYLGQTARRIGQTDLAVERCEESLRIYEAHGPESGVALASLELANAVRARDAARADGLYARAMAGFRAVGDRIGVYKVLVALAESMRERGEPDRAARMLGGVTAWGEADGSGRNPELAVRLGSATEEVRELLGEEEFALQFDEGRTYSYERLIDLADSLVRTVELRTAAG